MFVPTTYLHPHRAPSRAANGRNGTVASPGWPNLKSTCALFFSVFLCFKIAATFRFAVPMAGTVCPQVGNRCRAAPLGEAAEAARAREPSEPFFPRGSECPGLLRKPRARGREEETTEGTANLRVKGSPAEPRPLCLRARRPR